MQIKRMTEDEIPGMAALMKECFSHPWTQQDYRTQWQDPDKIYLVGIAQGMLVAGCAVWCSCETADLCNLAVRRDCRRKGYARQILREAVAQSGLQGASHMMLEVRAGNRAAIGLYEGFGFRKIGARKRYYTDPVEDAVIMELVFEETAK